MMALVALADDSDALFLFGAPGSSEDLGDWVEHLAGDRNEPGGWTLRFARPQRFHDAWAQGEQPDETLTHIAVAVELLDAAPIHEPDGRYARVVEVSCLEPPELEGSGSGPDPTASGPGPYRLRLMVDESRFPTRLTIQSWPAPVEAGRVLRGPLAPVEAELPPHPHMSLPEVPAGVSAAHRIGTDVDGGPGARALSGELGVARATLVMPRSPAWHSDFFDQARVWTANADYSTADYLILSFPGTPNEWWSVCAMKHQGQVDHITGWCGTIWTRPHLKDDQRRRRVHHWRWVRRIPPVPEDMSGGTMLGPVLPADTLRIVELNRVPGTPVHTEIVIEHHDVPVEWVDDLSAWWTLQLAIHAADV